MKTTSKILPERIIITRREDGYWDMEAFLQLPGFSCDAENRMAKVSLIIEDASFDIEVFYSPREDIDVPLWQETIPAKAISYHMTLSSWMREGVAGQPKVFMRQQIVEAP